MDGAVVEGIHIIQPWNKGPTHSTLSEQSSHSEVNKGGDQCIELQEYLRDNWYAW